ncbi:MAG: hypothetical protein ACHP65_01190 [Legionellales bacterium]
MLLLLFCFTSAYANTEQLNNQAFRNIWHPTFHGERLDYCTVGGTECGEKVANRYCQLMGYDYSSQNVIAYNVGLTHYFATKERCIGWRCNGFMTIGCATSLSHQPPKPYHYREQQFVSPRFNNYRVDWCYDHNKGCGSRSANSFCSHMGFMQAKDFVKEKQVGATQTIGSQELCFGEQCSAFAMITCYR